MKVHAHNTLFDESIFFAASPEDLGLTEENGLVSPGEVSNARCKKLALSFLNLFYRHLIPSNQKMVDLKITPKLNSFYFRI